MDVVEVIGRHRAMGYKCLYFIKLPSGVMDGPDGTGTHHSTQRAEAAAHQTFSKQFVSFPKNRGHAEGLWEKIAFSRITSSLFIDPPSTLPRGDNVGGRQVVIGVGFGAFPGHSRVGHDRHSRLMERLRKTHVLPFARARKALSH